MNDTYQLNELRPLSGSQYDAARAEALKRVQSRVGEKPTRSQFKREYGRLMTILDWIALLVFLAAFVVSSTHIIQLMKAEAANSFEGATGAGIQVSLNLYTYAHEIGLIALAELSAILFLVMHNLGQESRQWKHLSIFGVMALAAAVFVFYANVTSGLNPFIAVLPPLFTLGIGYRLEQIVVETMRRRVEIDSKYTEALGMWEAAQHDPTEHPDYLPFLRRAVWEKLVSYKANRDFLDAPPGFKVQAVQRELQRDTWAGDEKIVPIALPVHTNGNGKVEAVLNGGNFRGNGSGQ